MENDLTYSYSMGECSFGKSLGQTNPDKKAEAGVEGHVWKSIPRAIFDGQAKRYQVLELPLSSLWIDKNDNPRMST
jgi:hypothetical protein